jgi:nucleoside phosphorylase
VPFVVIRALSDTAAESASGDFASNLHKVCENSFRLLEYLVPKIGAGSADMQKAS